MRELFQDGRRYFDADLALELYESYLVHLDDSTMEELLLQLGALVDMVCAYDIGPSVGRCNHSTLKADAIQLVWAKLVEGKITTKNPRIFMNYLWVLIRNSMISSIRGIQPQQFEDWVSDADPTAGSVITHVGAEARVYAHQLCLAAFNMFKADIRFVGRERKACVFIAECLLGFRDLEPHTARWRFKLREGRVNFLISYVVYLLKNSADAVRKIDEVVVG